MKELQNKVTELFGNGAITLMIGFKEGINQEAVPCFLDDASQVDQLIWTPDCKNNLTTYLHKPEIKQAIKIGIMMRWR